MRTLASNTVGPAERYSAQKRGSLLRPAVAALTLLCIVYVTLPGPGAGAAGDDFADTVQAEDLSPISSVLGTSAGIQPAIAEVRTGGRLTKPAVAPVEHPMHRAGGAPPPSAAPLTGSAPRYCTHCAYLI